VAFPAGALPETIVEGETGHLIADGDEEALAARLEQLLRDRARARAMGQAARRRIETEFSEPQRLARTESFYEFLLSLPPR
jgi:glycosyltransferase involved in cell wall biosynthesis